MRPYASGDPRRSGRAEHRCRRRSHQRGGTLVASNRMEFLDIQGGYSVFTGTWKVIRGTGDYAELSGSGRIAGIVLPNGTTKWQREGFLGSN